MVARQAETEFEGLLDKDIKRNNKNLKWKLPRSYINSLPRSSLWETKVSESKLLFSRRVSEDLNRIEVMRNEVLVLTGNLKHRKSLGWDGIHHRVFKEFKYEIAALLAKIWNITKMSLYQRDWKEKPTFLKEDLGRGGNYRAVSLTSVPKKLVGKGY